LKTQVLLIVAFLAFATRECPALETDTDYLSKVRAYVDAMIEHGRDAVGKTPSPLFLISIDPQTMAIPNIERPRGLAVARLPASFRHCANPHLEQNLYQISKETPSRTGSEYPRHGGFYVATWAEAYRQTGERRMLDAIGALVDLFESRRNSKSGAIPAEQHARSKGELMWPQSNLSLAVDLWVAAAKVPDDLAQQMKNSARKIDKNFLRIPHDPGPDGRGFVKAAITSTLQPGDVRAIEAGHDHGGRWHPWSRPWETGYGVPTDGKIAMLCYLRYRQVPDATELKNLVVRSADRYLASDPPNKDNLVAGAMGDVIANLIAAYRLTKDKKYLDRAEHFADTAVHVFLTGGPLPQTTGKAADYCAASRCDTLMMQLLDLHLIRNRPEAEVPLIYTDR